jgi:hypothetical protein
MPMKTTKQLIAEVSAELNAVKAADMGLEAAQAFAQEAANQYAAGDVLKGKDALDNLLSLLVELRKAVPANVTPASAGPVGKSPHEQYLEQAVGIVNESLKRMEEATGKVRDALASAGESVQAALIATQALKSSDLKDAA